MTDVLGATLVSGVLLGSLYALMASGLSLVWTTLGVFNVAHGALMMLGAFVAWSVSVGLGLGVPIGILSGTVAAGVTGMVIERLLVRPFYGHRNMLLIAVMTTLAAMIIIEQTAQIIWGARLKQMPPIIAGKLSILGTTISAHEALIIVVAPTVLIALQQFIKRTAVGRSLRAAGQNQDAAALIGISVPQAFGAAFFLSAGLAGLAGALMGSIRFITPTLGSEPLVKAMIVVVFGGLSGLGATVGAAYVIGIIEALLILTIGLYWSPATLFFLVIVVLSFRPSGLFGKS